MKEKQYSVKDFKVSSHKMYLFFIDTSLVAFFGACAIMMVDNFKK